jgi:hypothetical protein
MNTLDRLNKLNSGITIYPVDDKAFSQYGKMYRGLDAEPVLSYLKENAAPEEKRGYYEASVKGMEVESSFKEYVKNNIFGGMDIQIGWCYGWNTKMMGMEYHKGSEVIVAATDCVVLLGRYEDIEFCNGRPSYDSSKTEAFYIEEGAVVELYPCTLHLSPTQTKADEQFITGVILDKGTNDTLSFTPQADAERSMLAAKNKWMLLHSELAVPKFGVVTGENIEIKTI